MLQEPLYFWLFCSYIIFEYVRPHLIYTSIDIIPWTKLCVLGALIGSLLSKEPSPSVTPLAKFYWGLIAVVVLSSICAEFPDYAFSKFNEVFNWLIIFYLFIRIVTSRYRFYVVLLLILLASFKMSQHAALSWMRRGFAFSRWGVAGAPGYFGNAADLGVQMLIVLPLSLAFIKGCQVHWGKLKKVFFILIPVSVIMAIIATGERNTIVGLAAMCLYFILTNNNRIKNLFLMAVFAVVFVSSMPQEYVDRFDTVGKDGTSLSRIRYWKRGIQFFENSPILGIGYYNWIPYYAKKYPGESLREEHQEIAHSTPIIVLAELGILGFIFYYGILVRMMFLNSASIKLANSENGTIWRNIPYALNLGIVGFLGASIFITVTFYPFLFIQASLSAALYNILSNEKQNTIDSIRILDCQKPGVCSEL